MRANLPATYAGVVVEVSNRRRPPRLFWRGSRVRPSGDPRLIRVRATCVMLGATTEPGASWPEALFVLFLAVPVVGLLAGPVARRRPPGGAGHPGVLGALRLSLATTASASASRSPSGRRSPASLPASFRGRRWSRSRWTCRSCCRRPSRGSGCCSSSGGAGCSAARSTRGVVDPVHDLAVVLAQMFVSAPFFVALGARRVAASTATSRTPRASRARPSRLPLVTVPSPCRRSPPGWS